MGSQFPDHYESPESPWGAPPGINDPEFKVLNSAGRPDAIYQADVVKVVVFPGEYNTVQISWPSIQGAVSYSVYVGHSLFVTQATLVATQPGVDYTYKYSPTISPDIMLQAWIKVNFATGDPMYIQAEPASAEAFKDYFARSQNPLEPSYSAIVGDNDYMRFIAAEIRRRAILMLQNDGEEFMVYMRRWSGAYCNCNQTDANLVSGPDAIQGALNDPLKGIGAEPDLSEDPQNDALARCPKCLGTGIIGAYYYGISTLMRYGNLPPRAIVYKNFAIDLPHNFNTWTVWEPKLHEHDIVRRIKTGEVFEVTKPARGEWRGVPFHQEAFLQLLPPGDPRYLVTDSFIQRATGQYDILPAYSGGTAVDGEIVRRVENEVVNGGEAESSAETIIGGGGASL